MVEDGLRLQVAEGDQGCWGMSRGKCSVYILCSVLTPIFNVFFQKLSCDAKTSNVLHNQGSFGVQITEFGFPG